MSGARVAAGGDGVERGPGARRSVTIGVKQVKKLVEAERGDPELERWMQAAFIGKPRTRGECVGQPRPCPWVSCRYHLFLECTPMGGLKLLWPDKEPDELEDCCALDVAERGKTTLEAVAELLNVTRERARQIERMGIEQARLTRIIIESQD